VSLTLLAPLGSAGWAQTNAGSDTAFHSADMLASRGLHAGAIRFYLEGLQQSPGDPRGLVGLGESYLATGKLAEAEAALRKAADSADPAVSARARNDLARLGATRQAPANDELEEKLKQLKQASVEQQRQQIERTAELSSKKSTLRRNDAETEKYRPMYIGFNLDWLHIYHDRNTSRDVTKVTPTMTEAVRYYQQRAGMAPDGRITEELKARMSADVTVVMLWAGDCFGHGQHPANTMRDYGDGRQVRGWEANGILGSMALAQALIWRGGAMRGEPECPACNYRICRTPPPELELLPNNGWKFEEPG